MTFPNRFLLSLSVLSAGAAPLAAPATAADAADATDTDDSVISEVMVLGRGYAGEMAGAKSLVPVFETPSSITVIDLQRIEDQRLITLEDLLRQTAGITTTKTVSSYPTFFARGFQVSSFLVDGVPGISGVSAPYSVPDLFLYEGVELLRGPSALFSGSGSPGGSINLTRKRPTSEFQLTGSLQAGSWDFYRGELDVSAPLNASGSVRGRAGAAYQDAGEFIDNYQKDRNVAFGSVALDLSETTTLTVGGHYDDYQSTIQVGLPGIAGVGLIDLPRSTYIGGTRNRFETRTKQGYAELAQSFAGRWHARATVQYTNLDREEKYFYGRGPITADDGGEAAFGYHGRHDASLLSGDISAVGEFDLFGRTHGLLFGFDYQRAEWEYRSVSNFDENLVLDVYASRPVPEAALPIVRTDPEYYTGLEIRHQHGVYGQTRLTLTDSLTAVVGGRVSWVSFDFRDFDALSGVYEVDSKLTPYVGLIYDIAPGWNLYASYADVFQPQSELNIDRNPIGPVIGKQYEVGVKSNVFDERLLLSAAVYRIRQSNRAVADPNPDNAAEGASVGSGLVESKGFELEANGRLGVNWTFNGGYSYNKNEVLRDSDPVLVGTQFIAVVPKHSVKLFSNYEFDDFLPGLSIGGGLTWAGEAQGTGVVQDSYTVLGLRAGYDLNEQVALSLNIDNALDEKYYSEVRDPRFGNYYGAPRSAFVAVRVKY